MYAPIIRIDDLVVIRSNHLRQLLISSYDVSHTHLSTTARRLFSAMGSYRFVGHEEEWCCTGTYA